ncbi:hypothetical protein [Streptomyces niveus]|uniref:hypothetical protein n=1 Tax=Streptomyces niveus TaxID=193462 RepID=UPI00342C967F
MDRVYMNRRDGERRIHVEIDEQEIPALLADLAARGSLSGASRNLLAVLEKASADFGWGG